MAEGSESSTGFNTVELGQDALISSPEDIAWADSCLSNDPEMLDSGWNALRVALFETLDAQNHSPLDGIKPPEETNMEICCSGNTCTTSSVEEETAISIATSSEGADCVQYSPESAWLETLSTEYHCATYDRVKSPLVLLPPVEEIHSSEDINNMHESDKAPVSIASTSEGTEQNSEDRLIHEKTEDFWSKHKVEDVFLPTYSEDLRDLGVSDPEVDFVFQEDKAEQSIEDIFMIWDFDIPAEENDLMKQLRKALAENSSEPTMPPVSDDSEAWKGLQDVALDDLISGIADLALSRKAD